MFLSGKEAKMYIAIKAVPCPTVVIIDAYADLWSAVNKAGKTPNIN